MKKRALLILAVCLLALFLWQMLTIGAERRDSQSPLNKVGVLLNGSAQDGGFSQSLAEAARDVCEEKSLTFIRYDGVTVEAFPETVQNLMEEGCGLIVCDSEEFDPGLEQLAKDNPGVCFFNAMGAVTARNLSSCFRRTYQARYLLGITAGCQTVANEIGMIVSSFSSETIRQINAFTLGVRRVNENARVFVRCTNDPFDAETAAAVTNELLDAHSIDVLCCHGIPYAAMETANRRGVWLVGYVPGDEIPFPDTWLAGYAFDWKPFLTQCVEDWRANRFVGRQYSGGVRSGLVHLTPFGANVREETRDVVEAELARLLDGSFDVFFGPVRDRYGTVQVREGETMSDERILHGMNWFVEGVTPE
ncbi:MAG: BMP family ABC transporter substrate-binding protein [Oscillibacter sp.]|nr:BMP family ABC transporter substrate-binding protein [Oscillibacter sp.]